MRAYWGGMVVLPVAGLFAWPLKGDAQAIHAQLDVGYSAPAPAGLRGRLTSPSVIGSAIHGGLLVGVGVERGTELGFGVEAVYSHHSSPSRHFIGTYRGEIGSAAEKEETTGVMGTAFVPVAHVWGKAVRLRGSVGVLRTRLEGYATVGGDAGGPAEDSHAGPAVGVGFEVPVPCMGHALLLAVRSAQLLGRERGGGYVAGTVGLRW